MPAAELLDNNFYIKPVPTTAELQRIDHSTEAFAFLLAELLPVVLLLRGQEDRPLTGVMGSLART